MLQISLSFSVFSLHLFVVVVVESTVWLDVRRLPLFVRDELLHRRPGLIPMSHVSDLRKVSSGRDAVEWSGWGTHHVFTVQVKSRSSRVHLVSIKSRQQSNCKKKSIKEKDSSDTSTKYV